MNKNNTWDTSYEWKAVALLGIGFGLVGLDRWIIAPLFPFIAQDLGLAGRDRPPVGTRRGMGVFAIFSGRLSDKIGHRKVLIPAIILFSLMSGLSGMVTELGSDSDSRAHGRDGGNLLPPTSFTAVAAASKPGGAGSIRVYSRAASRCSGSSSARSSRHNC